MALTDSVSNTAIFLAAFGVALLGSGHCIAMCGGLASSVEKAGTPFYHLGRGSSYLVMGTLSGALGSAIFQRFDAHPAALLFVSIAFFIVLFLQAILVWQGSLDSSRTMKVQRWAFRRWFAPMMNRYSKSSNSFLFGLSSAFVPCGWILSFGWSAAATGSAFKGALIFLALWMGTLPALLAASNLIVLVRKKFAGRVGRRLTAVVIMALSLGTLWNRMSSFESTQMGGAVGPHEVFCLPKR